MAAPDQCSLSSIDGSLSIDRLTLLFYCPKLSLWNSGCDNSMYVRKMSNLVENVLRSDLDPDFPQGSRTELFDQHYRTLSGFDIQFGTRMPKRKKIKDENYLIAFGSPKDIENGFAWHVMANEYALRTELCSIFRHCHERPVNIMRSLESMLRTIWSYRTECVGVHHDPSVRDEIHTCSNLEGELRLVTYKLQRC